jgi:hypothetical protein
LAFLASIPPAFAAEETDVASALDEEDPFDLHVTVDYAFSARRAAIKREVTTIVDPSGGTAVAKDLVYRNNRHLITPRIGVGVYKDLELRFALPIVVADTRDLRFDQRAEPCVFTGTPTCINRDNSTTLDDAFLPDGTQPGGLGYDARDPTTNFLPDSTMVFRGQRRSGLDQLHLGLAWAAMNQRRDDTKPTWVIGAEARISIGKIQKFNRLDPGAENGVSRGVHEIRLFTAASKQLGWIEPYVLFYWLGTLGTRGDAPGDAEGSLYWDVGFGQASNRPQQQAGAHFGFEAAVWQRPAQEQRVTLTFAGRVDSIFEGMGYSEMWEVFAYAGDAVRDPGARLVIDRDPTGTSDAPLSHPGVTVIQNYLSFGAQLGVAGHVGPHAKFHAAFELGRDQSHRISFTDAGIESTDSDDVITAGTREVNPLHRPGIDLPGRRYLVDDATTYTFTVNGSVLF